MDNQLQLDEIKQIELEILKNFDKICRDNDLEYSLAYGTMIGAVRHHGFIPWDDDIDVFMKRADYEKLMALQYEDDDYEIKSYRYSRDYYYPFAKMSDKHTELIEDWRLEKNLGVYIDIFPLDYINANSQEELNEIKKKASKADDLAFWMGHKLSHHKSFSVKYFVKLVLLLLTYPFKKQIIKRADYLNVQNSKGQYCAMLLQLMNSKTFMDAFLFDEVIYVDFEDFKAPIYKEYDSILTSDYGDYMTPPPVEQQKSVHWFKVYRR